MTSEPILFADVKETPHLKRKVIVYCDDIEVKNCITANVAEGWCEVFAVNAEGRKYLNAARTDAVRQRIYGTVRIERKAGT